MLDPNATFCTSNLSVLHDEVYYKIISEKILTVFDRACFMLMCKTAACVVSSNATMSIPKIAHGMEEEAIEWQSHMICSECGYDDSEHDYDDDERMHECGGEERLSEVMDSGSRGRQRIMSEFFERLGKGWN